MNAFPWWIPVNDLPDAQSRGQGLLPSGSGSKLTLILTAGGPIEPFYFKRKQALDKLIKMFFFGLNKKNAPLIPPPTTQCCAGGGVV
jgi:hypothetical protein